MPEHNVPRPRGRALAPAEFAAAVRSLAVTRVRDEVRVEEVRPPQKLAPWTHALALTVLVDDEELATGRLVLLHDPAGYEAWEGWSATRRPSSTRRWPATRCCRRSAGAG